MLSGGAPVGAESPITPGSLPAPIPNPEMTGQPAAPMAEMPAPQEPHAIAADLLRRREGFRETPYFDVNAHRAGYGSDTMTMADGTVRQVQPGMTVSREDAERDLRRRIPEFEQRAISNIGQEAYSALSPNARAALISVAYNYGNIPERIRGAARSGDAAALSSAVAGLAGDNRGVNADRRREEAEIIAGRPGQTAQASQAPVMPAQAPAPPQGAPQRGAGDTVIIGGRSFSMPAIMQAMTDPDPQVSQTARTLFAAAQSQERESFSAPQAVQQNGETVMVQFGNRGTSRVVPGMTPARERSQPDRDRARYAELAGRQGSLTPSERIELEAVAKAVFGADNVQVGPSGIAVLPAPRPGMGSGDTMPASQGASPDGLARPANDAMANASASPAQRPPQQVALPDGRTAQYIPGEQPQAQPPATMASAMLNNAASLRSARVALDLVNQRPQSFGLSAGLQNMAPGLLERTDPDGTAARAAVANLGSLVIHDRSGAAVTAAEFPRLRPFIPQIGDPPEVVKTKLKAFAREYEDLLKDQYGAFGPSSGYRPLAPVDEALRPSGARQGAAQPGTAPSGAPSRQNSQPGGGWSIRPVQ
jgi:hypothetical protein